jgi:hypothetical protein
VHEVELVDARDRHRQQEERDEGWRLISPSASKVAFFFTAFSAGGVCGSVRQ